MCCIEINGARQTDRHVPSVLSIVSTIILVYKPIACCLLMPFFDINPVLHFEQIEMNGTGASNNEA